MAYYGILVEMELDGAETVTVRYEIRDDAVEPDMLIASEHVSFPWIVRDGAGEIVSETLGVKRGRLQAAFDAEVDGMIAALSQAAAQFETLRGQALGYRHP